MNLNTSQYSRAPGMSRFLRGCHSNDRFLSVTGWAGATPTGARIASAAIANTADGTFAKSDDVLRLADEPDHDALCHREQEYFLSAIRDDLDLSDHQDGALAAMRIVEAADESFRTGRSIDL